MSPADDTTQRTTAVARILHDRTQGERQRADDLLPLVYDELRSLARARMARKAPGQTRPPMSAWVAL